ncbi:VWA domain-containing protein [Fibrisoma montanum]|uniref:VWA domain-containing protein n=1 Tax=Fibrisoma montanum TaxID=2305895 RepID=A0A418M8M1_9BACT|nr:VWA domain-containing protein [Fibrisoma montanum]RIV22445.1 VWA domain-containing protein [Fibrisoma montanum]
MQYVFLGLLIFSSVWATAHSLQETPQQSLNQYVAFLNQSTDEVTNRFRMIQTYVEQVERYREKPTFQLRLPSSGPLEDYYYKKALAADGLTPAEKQRLTAGTQALWQLLTSLDETGKTLETYVRLQDYQRDTLKQSDALLSRMQTLATQFSQDKDALFKQIQRVYRRYQPYLPANAYLFTEKEMDDVLQSQKQLFDSLTFYMNEEATAAWPLKTVQNSILTDEKTLLALGKAKSAIEYPASDMINSFTSALQTLQDLKRRAVDDYTFAARQSARHGNAFYLSFLNYYNNDLLAARQSFVQYSTPAKHLLNPSKLSPVFALESPRQTTQATGRTQPFADAKPIEFTIKPAAAPEEPTTFRALTNYVTFINEALRQQHKLQMLLRNYQSSAEYYRNPLRTRKGGLTYSHDEFKIPLSEHQLLVSESRYVPQPYRTSINGQAEVLLNMLNEMDGLSIELIAYTTENQYLLDGLQRSDAILDRYIALFDAFDQKKERLYQDVRRIHESYPVARPTSWHVAGKALLQTIDNNHDVLFGIKAFLKGETSQLPATDKLTTDARTLIRDEYQNLKGLQRYGRSNGLCPYSPYEDVAEKSLRFAEKSGQVKTADSRTNPFESIYYFYNNELIYEYNKFSELAKAGVLKAVNQPDLFILRRNSVPKPAQPIADKPEPPAQPPVAVAVQQVPATSDAPARLGTGATDPAPDKPVLQHDTVYVDRTRVDTVFIDRSGTSTTSGSLAGFAPNNLVLLLDVSSSMNSPFKMPLLKQSIKSLLKLLRPEDQVSVVVYSGKAKVALKPTPGNKADEIARLIDGLQSDGDTDGDGGIRLAYKLANKHYIRAGNNRIVLATDGEFPISDDVYRLVAEQVGQDVFLTVFTFGRNQINSQQLRRMASAGKGNYVHITPANARQQLVLEAQAKKEL